MKVKDQIKRMKKYDLKDNQVENATTICGEYLKNILVLAHYITSNVYTEEKNTEKFKEATSAFESNMKLITYILSSLYNAPMQYQVVGDAEFKPTTFGASFEMLNEVLKKLNKPEENPTKN